MRLAIDQGCGWILTIHAFKKCQMQIAKIRALVIIRKFSEFEDNQK